jgi:hypothetical protein
MCPWDNPGGFGEIKSHQNSETEKHEQYSELTQPEGFTNLGTSNSNSIAVVGVTITQFLH